MKITQADKDAVFALLAANPKASTQPMLNSEVAAKTGFSIFKLNLIKKELLAGGMIREESLIGERLKIYLMVPDKRQQILDLMREKKYSGTSTFVKFTGLNTEQIYQICIRLINEGLAEVQSIQIRLLVHEPVLAGEPGNQPGE